jgi:hypothetical protein
MFPRVAFLAVVALVIAGWSAWAEQASQPKPPSTKPAEKPDDAKNFWMKKKLEYTEHVLEGLATADFDSISKSATAMNRITQIENFTRRTNVEAYRTQLRAFRFANEELIRQADKQNIDGVALAFTQLTLSCVNCHKVLRDTKE